VTGGTNIGVMKHVGEAVRNHTMTHGKKKPIVAIGIAPWGFISNRDQLIDDRVCISATLRDCSKLSFLPKI